MNDTHPVESLFERLRHFGPYPAGVVPVPERIPATAFFPGGAGLWGVVPGEPLPPAPTGGILILGHNFDSEAGFYHSLRHQGENLRGETWRNLLRLLCAAGIAPEGCFFTNMYMGLIAGDRAVGIFPGSRDDDYVRRCRDFLFEQLRLFQPKLILTLGKEVIPVLAPMSPELARAWTGAQSLSILDSRDAALIYPVRFSSVPHAVAVVALTHPAFRHLNIARRHYCGVAGGEAELALLKAGLEEAAPLSPSALSRFAV